MDWYTHTCTPSQVLCRRTSSRQATKTLAIGGVFCGPHLAPGGHGRAAQVALLARAPRLYQLEREVPQLRKPRVRPRETRQDPRQPPMASSRAREGRRGERSQRAVKRVAMKTGRSASRRTRPAHAGVSVEPNAAGRARNYVQGLRTGAFVFHR